MTWFQLAKVWLTSSNLLIPRPEPRSRRLLSDTPQLPGTRWCSILAKGDHRADP
jgi:hypothetical protein